MEPQNSLSNPEFDNRFNSLKESIENYLNEINYDLKELEIENIIKWNDWGKQRKIYVSEKCPSDIKFAITELIKKEFPNPNETN